jgi:hypothetical protein
VRVPGAGRRRDGPFGGQGLGLETWILLFHKLASGSAFLGTTWITHERTHYQLSRWAGGSREGPINNNHKCVDVWVNMHFVTKSEKRLESLEF